MRIDRQKKGLVILICLVFIIIFFFTCLTPLAADDYDYSFSMSSGLRVSSFYELFRSMDMHRYHINGRYFSHFFAMFFLWMPKLLFNFLNACMASILVYIIFKYISILFNEESVKYTAIWCILVFCFTPTFGQITLWLDGACNYLWSFVFILIYLYPFFCLWFDQYTKQKNFLSIISLIIEAFIAGAYSEIGSLMVLFISFIILIERILKNKRIPKELFFVFVSGCAGFLFLFLAPATINHRMKGSDNTNYVFPLFSYIKPVYFIIIILAFFILLLLMFSFLRNKQMCYIFLFGFGISIYLLCCLIMLPDVDSSNLIRIVGSLISESSWNVLTITLLCYLVFLYNLRIEEDKRRITMGILFVVASLISVAVMQIARYMAARMFSYYVIFLSLGSIIVLQKGSYKKKYIRYREILLCTIFILHFLIGSYDVLSVHHVETIRKKRIIEAQLTHAEITKIPLYNPISKYPAVYGLDDVKDYEEGWPNQSMCDYFEINAIISE